VKTRGGARAHAKIDRTVVPARPEALRGSSDVGLFDTLQPALFLVDGNNLLWRAAHGPRAPFEASDGRDLTALFRFVSMLRRVLGTYGLFSECVVCFDGADAWSERLDLDATYKGNRRYADADLSFMGWLPEIRAALDCAGVTNLEVTDSEADDVIATLAFRAGTRPVRILSTDRDYFQLIGPATTVVNPRGRPALVDEMALVARYRVTSGQWCDFRTLAGDPSDGIPGLPGVGPSKAAAMLAGGKTLEDLRTNAVDIVSQRWDDLCRWRELIRLRTDVVVDFQPTGSPTPRLPSSSAVCAELGLLN
jgi:DNA polymerase-1